MDLSWEKWLVMAALALISIGLGLIPFFLFREKRKIFPYISPPSLPTTTNIGKNKENFFPKFSSKLVLTILSCFGGGVLLATAIVHMLTEARDDLAHIPEIWETIPSDFALAEVLTLVGFGLIYFVEEIAHFIMIEDGQHHNVQTSVLRQNSIAHSITPSLSDIRKISRISRISRLSSSVNGNMENGNGTGLVVPRVSLPLNNKIQDGFNLNSTTTKIQQITVLSNSPAVMEQVKEENEEAHEEENNSTARNVSSSLRSLLALIALSFHAIMEGIAIGIQNSTDVWFMFGAVASHKFVISFCMGMELHVSRAKTSTFLSSIIFFGVISPVGILIGSLISGNGGSSTNTLPVAIIKALSTGTLLYVVFFEILNREKEKKSERKFNALGRAVGFIQFVSVVVGMVAMVTMISLSGHSHAHDEDEHTEEDHTDHDHSHDDHVTASQASSYTNLKLLKIMSKSATVISKSLT